MMPPSLRIGETVWDWSRPYIMGIVNVTPDSFSDGGRYATVDSALRHAMELLEGGADALDIGGESTRPGAVPVSVEEELARTLPLIEALAARARVPLSIDTTKSIVARAALDAGAHIVNDVGMGDPPEQLGAVAASAGAAYLAMHARGNPDTMRSLARYVDAPVEVARELSLRVKILESVGVSSDRVLVDPGVGFAKTALQSIEILANLSPVVALGYAVCVGPSRKSFVDSAEAYAASWGLRAGASIDRVGGTAAAVTMAVLQGAQVLRVHDVATMRQAARVAHAMKLAGGRHV